MPKLAFAETLAQSIFSFDDTGRETANLSHTRVVSSLDVHPELVFKANAGDRRNRALSLIFKWNYFCITECK